MPSMDCLDATVFLLCWDNAFPFKSQNLQTQVCFCTTRICYPYPFQLRSYSLGVLGFLPWLTSKQPRDKVMAEVYRGGAGTVHGANHSRLPATGHFYVCLLLQLVTYCCFCSSKMWVVIKSLFVNFLSRLTRECLPPDVPACKSGGWQVSRGRMVRQQSLGEKDN
jgi:hypothetical protein